MPRYLHYAVHPDNPQPRLLSHAADVIRAGGVAVLPTAAGYLPACRLDDKAAALKLRRLLGTAERDPAVLLCRDLPQASVYLLIDNGDFRSVRGSEPGSAAFLLPCTRRVPRRLAAASRNQARLYFAGHKATQALLEQFDEALLMAPAPWGPGPEAIADLPLPWQHAIDLALDAGPLQAPALDVFAPSLGEDVESDLVDGLARPEQPVQL